jgi:ADP-heptose:LPS heptosyltransferase
LRRHDFSIALIFTGVAQSSLRAAYACNLAGIPYRVGFAQGLSQTVLSHFVIPSMDDMHQVDRNLDLLRAIGISGENQTVELNIPPSIENRAEDLLKAAGVKTDTPYIVFAPGSSGVLGPYDPGHYATVAHILAAQAEQQLVIVGSSTDAKGIQPVLQVVTENLYGNVHSLVDKTTLPELAAVIEHASLTVANHSISMHFADAFGCPMVILYSENDRIQQWAPRHASARLLRRPAVCSRCEQVGCLNGMNCRDVRPEEVAIAALEILSEQTIDQVEYKRIFEYKFQSETNQQWAIC